MVKNYYGRNTRVYQKGKNQHKLPMPKLVRNEVENNTEYLENYSLNNLLKIMLYLVVFFVIMIATFMD